MTKDGWQQPAVEPTIKKDCPHIGLLFAAMGIRWHPPGHIWRCTCGQEFMVVSDGLDGPRQLVKRNG